MPSRLGSQEKHGSRNGRRYPADYCWQLLALLFRELRNQVDVELGREMERVIRTRSIPGYYELDALCGLQCMATWSRPYRGNPAVVRLLGSVIRKHEMMELVKASERKKQCLESVKTLDASLFSFRNSWNSDPVYLRMKERIREILGPRPDSEVIAENARHGPGSSITHSFEHRSAYFKYAEWPYAVSRRARALLIEVIKLDPRWIGALEQAYRTRYRLKAWNILNQDVFWANVVNDEYQWNRVTTVPKDGTKDRPIAIEPAGNIYLQLGIEGVIRQRLKTVGIDLDSQNRNRRLCLLFSRENNGATLDLSNASDTVSREFCRAVLPPGWFDLLDCVRSPSGEFPDGAGWHYAKMSSMGNATTFVLESLLFYALSWGISQTFGSPKDRISVFGDDLMIEGYLARHHYIYLRESGFIPNMQKSFVTGNVRESCGVDAFNGEDIRPVFLKRQPRSDMDVYNDRNRLNRWFAVHFGTENPRSVDDFFMKYIGGDLLLGPESDTEFDGYWHDSRFPCIAFKSAKYRVAELPGREFFFRKLMHNLRGPSEGGKFLIQEVREGAISVVQRTPSYSSGYATGGFLLDHPKQPYGANAP